MEIIVTAIGVFILGLMIGLTIGSEDQTKMIQKAFEKEGYDYDKFNDVIHKADNN
jgi:hypothetical protein